MTFQALLVDMDTPNKNADASGLHDMYITNSKRISPAVELRKSLQNQKSIYLWRMSDIFYDAATKDYTIHYQVSFQYVQHIDRLQIWEYQTKITTDPKLRDL